VLRRYLESNGVWTWKEDYIWGPSGLLATASPTDGIKHYTLDHLGSPRLVTSGGSWGGYQLALHDYYPFGQEATSPAQDSELIKFTGQERDLNLTDQTTDDLDYMHARYYAFHIGRFMTVDPVRGTIGSSQSWDGYSYVKDNPVNLADPTGKKARVLNEEASHLLQEELGADAKLLTRDKNGNLSLHATPEQLDHNEALKAVNDVIKAKERYGISVGTSVPNLGGTLSLASVGGAINLSKTPDLRFRTPALQRKYSPPSTFDAVIAVDPATLAKAVGQRDGLSVSPAKVLFHETAESFERTTHGRQRQQAHAAAVQRERVWARERPSLLKFAPGAGPLRFPNGY